MKDNMKELFKKVIRFLQRAAHDKMTLAFVLATIAEMLTHWLIPGQSVIELVISAIVALVVFWLSIKEHQATSMIEAIHRNYQPGAM